jgi:predicted CoA-binding protein
VVGATDNPAKFGYKIYRFLRGAGFAVYAVNPDVATVLGDKCYPTLSDLPVRPEAVDIVVPPRVGERIIRECAALGIKNVWLQPGSDGPNVVRAAEELGLNVVRACVMSEARKQGLWD